MLRPLRPIAALAYPGRPLLNASRFTHLADNRLLGPAATAPLLRWVPAEAHLNVARDAACVRLDPCLVGLEDDPDLPGALPCLVAVVLVVAQAAAIGSDVGAAAPGPFADRL